jgi:hypothetical protein
MSRDAGSEDEKQLRRHNSGPIYASVTYNSFSSEVPQNQSMGAAKAHGAGRFRVPEDFRFPDLAQVIFRRA